MKEHKLAHIFQGIYANIPMGVRNEIVAVIDHEPMTFKIVKMEVDGNTKVGHRALDQLRKLEII